MNTVTGRVRAVEYQGTFLKVTLLADPPLAADGGDDFVAYVNEASYFRAPILAGTAAMHATAQGACRAWHGPPASARRRRSPCAA